MSNFLVVLLQYFKVKLQFPKEYKGYSYCTELYRARYKAGTIYTMAKSDDVKYPIPDEFAFNFLKCGKENFGRSSTDHHLVEGLIPAMLIDGWLGLYKVSKVPYIPRNTSTSDLCAWDDGHAVDLKFVKCIKVGINFQLPLFKFQRKPSFYCKLGFHRYEDWREVECWAPHAQWWRHMKRVCVVCDKEQHRDFEKGDKLNH